jgi:hypothetical protein
MVESRENFRFALEPSQPLGVSHHRLRQDLDGHGPLQIRVNGAVYLAHSANADLGGHFVRTEAGAGREDHLLRPDHAVTTAFRRRARTRRLQLEIGNA